MPNTTGKSRPFAIRLPHAKREVIEKIIESSKANANSRTKPINSLGEWILAAIDEKIAHTFRSRQKAGEKKKTENLN